MLKVLDLFSGIGGFSLGLERTGGFKTVAFCEIDPFCRKVLAKHWPHVPCYKDVRELNLEQLSQDGITADVITGGFPCQDISLAGKRAGLEGARSGLWKEYRRLVSEIRPNIIVVENTPGLLSLGMGTVLGDLASLGYDAEWHCISAAYVGADHIRDRVWIIAYAVERQPELERWTAKPSSQMAKNASDALCSGLSKRLDPRENCQDAGRVSAGLGLALSAAPSFPGKYRKHKPVLGRGVHGVSNRVDRIAALGNSVVPQITELIGRAIMNAEAAAIHNPITAGPA